MVDGLLQVEGGRPLTGEITVRGAKNLVPKAMVAALLGSTPSVLRNVPLIRDVDVVSGLLAGRNVNIINTGRTLHTDEYGNGQDKSRQRSAMGWRCDVRQACLREITAGGSLFCGPEK